MKQRIGVVCKDQEHFEAIRKKNLIHFEYFDVIPIFWNEIIQGKEISRITFDELKNIEEIKK